MEYFWSDGGNNRPAFLYRYKVDRVTPDMYVWAENYPSKGPFTRFHVIWNAVEKNPYDIIQFESRDAYLAFKYAFSGEVLEDMTWKEYQ